MLLDPGVLSLYSMKECQNAQPCLLSNYFTGNGQVNIDGEHL